MKVFKKKLTTIIMTLIITVTAVSPAFAADTPVINLGTFRNTYREPTDAWVNEDWKAIKYSIEDSEGARSYLLLYEYNGTDTDLEIPGKGTYYGEELQVMICNEDRTTNTPKSMFEDNTTIKTIKFIPVDGVKVAVGPYEWNASKLFKGMTALESVDFNDGFQKITNMDSMFEGDTKLKEVHFTGVDTSECTSAVKTFDGCTALTNPDLANIDLSKVNNTSDMFRNTTALTAVDLSKASWKSNISNTGGMFENDAALKEIKVGSDFNAGTTKTDMFKVENDTLLKITGSPSDTFLNNVTPEFESYNRYLGEAEIKANVTLTGKDLTNEMFTYKLYKDSISTANLIGTVKNDASGNISFGKFKVRDISSNVKFIAVQEPVENITNDSGNLTADKSIKLNADGSLLIE